MGIGESDAWGCLLFVAIEPGEIVRDQKRRAGALQADPALTLARAFALMKIASAWQGHFTLNVQLAAIADLARDG